MSFEKLEQIIFSKSISPTIVNENSKFVVSTYWWGRGNFNQNTARPCIAFFEFVVRDYINLLKGIIKKTDPSQLRLLISKIEKILPTTTQFETLITKKANEYNKEIYNYLKIKGNNFDEAERMLNEFKLTGKTPSDYKLRNIEEIQTIIGDILLEVLRLIKPLLVNLLLNEKKRDNLKEEYLNKKENEEITTEDINTFKRRINEIHQEIRKYKDLIKKELTKKQNHPAPLSNFENMSIYDIFHKQLRFINPIKYEEMIKKWENECEKNNCNHMAVEYPEFAQPGGYQLAINAKPIFIKKALESTGDRSVLYIDGDMYIRKYPEIFDMTEIDYMARGWNIDPRSSSALLESVYYDPYNFQTSGGTMCFSQSKQSKFLVDKWIEVAKMKSQEGKADDRLISLIYNSYKMLLPLKTIQLPIEYLWLTLGYNYRLVETLYDWNEEEMLKSIFIEHPECLTTEETAGGEGASSDRNPKYYGYQEYDLDPVSETFHEYIMFPNNQMVSTFQPYLDWMSTATYLDDGDDYPIDKGLVFPSNPEENKNMLYVINYNDKYGNNKYINDDSITYNQVAEKNEVNSNNLNIEDLNLKINGNSIEINDFTKLMKEGGEVDDEKIIALIIKLLNEGKEVIYNPTFKEKYDKTFYDILMTNKNNKYDDMEFVFAPIFNEGAQRFSSFYFKPKININQAILFRPSKILISFLMMYLSLNDFSNAINYGLYEFLSRVRVGYLLKKACKRTTALIGGGNGWYHFNEDDEDLLFMEQNINVNNYNDLLDSTLCEMSAFMQEGGGKRIKMKKITRRKKNKKSRRKTKSKK